MQRNILVRRGAPRAFAAALLLAALAGCVNVRPSSEVDADAGSGGAAVDPAAQLRAAVASRPIVLLGEVHDNAAQHALRVQALRSLLDGGARPALLMEQFDREHQAALDAALARPEARVDDLIAAAAPSRAAMLGWDWALYRPYLALALEYRLPVVAANVSRADTRRVLKEGLAATGFDGRVPADIRTAQAASIAEGHCGMLSAAQAGDMVGAQIARDQFMARMIALHEARGVVLLAGNGHVRRDLGVPRWLEASLRERSVSIGLLEQDSDEARGPRRGFDVAVRTPAQPRPDPCADLHMPAPAAARAV